VENGSATGHIGYWSLEKTDGTDWYVVTTSQDGELMIQTRSAEALDLEISIYADDQATHLAGSNLVDDERLIKTSSRKDLAPGTYYIRIQRGYYRSVSAGSYTITSALTPSSYVNDTEPNDAMDTAAAASVGTTVNGHLKYTDGHVTDTVDYFVFTLSSAMEKLYVNTVYSSDLNPYVELYSSSGSTLAGKYATETLEYANAEAGTYYIRMSLAYYSGTAGSYAFIISGSPDTVPEPQEITTDIGSIAGTVTDADTDGPIVGATVKVSPGDFSTATGSDGSYLVSGVPAGTGYTVTVTAEGYESESEPDVEVVAGETADVSFHLMPPGQWNDANGNWAAQTETLHDTPEADIMVRTGDIDNLGFGWPEGFDPFSGRNTPAHGFPWTADPADAPGTDVILIGSGYTGSPPSGSDGYASNVMVDELPQPITLTYDLQGVTISSAAVQVFVDDFQAASHAASYQVTLDGVRIPVFERAINSLAQTGPIGKLVTLEIPDQYLDVLDDGEVEFLIDDPATGAGDGYAIDFVKLLINPGEFSYTGTVAGTVTDADTGEPVAGARVRAAGNVIGDTAEDGTYELSGVPSGIVVVTAKKPGYSDAEGIAELETGGTATIDLELAPSGLEEIYFSDDFEDGTVNPEWELVGGTWTEADGVMHQTNNQYDSPYSHKGGVFALVGDESWDDYTVFSSISSNDNDRMGLVFLQ